MPFSETRFSIVDQRFTMSVHAMELARTFDQTLFKFNALPVRLYRMHKLIRLGPKMSTNELFQV